MKNFTAKELLANNFLLKCRIYTSDEYGNQTNIAMHYSDNLEQLKRLAKEDIAYHGNRDRSLEIYVEYIDLFSKALPQPSEDEIEANFECSEVIESEAFRNELYYEEAQKLNSYLDDLLFYLAESYRVTIHGDKHCGTVFQEKGDKIITYFIGKSLKDLPHLKYDYYIIIDLQNYIDKSCLDVADSFKFVHFDLLAETGVQLFEDGEVFIPRMIDTVFTRVCQILQANE